jgi:hypothetical protein
MVAEFPGWGGAAFHQLRVAVGEGQGSALNAQNLRPQNL